MKKIHWKNTHFVKTAMEFSQLPSHPSGQLPEIAVVGRSNVGKSTLLNHLFQNQKLVKTSQKPGKTQGINYFKVDDALFVVDLPGYGFAKVPKAVRDAWGPMIQEYLEKRSSLQLILFLFDVRREINEDDLKLIEWLKYHQMPVIVVFTKIDKILKAHIELRGKHLLESMELKETPFVYYSAPKNLGRKDLISAIEQSTNL